MDFKRSAFWGLLSILFAFALVFNGCGGESKRMSEDEVSAEVIFEETPPGALPDVSAEQGGEGFTGEGWSSNFDYEPTADPNAIPGGTFTMGIYTFPSTLRIVGKDSNSEFLYRVQSLVYESLTGIHPETMAITPGLATHWQISDDKMTFRFRINPEARFSDGSRVTAEDVVASWKLRVDPGILAPYSNVLYGKFEEPVAESPYIVKVRCKELNWRFFIYFGGMDIMPAKYIGNIDGKQYMRAYQFKFPPGSGSYVLDDVKKGRSLTMKKRDDYWDKDNPKGKGALNFDKLKFLVVEDIRLMFEKFKAGELDFYQVGRAQWWVEECDFENVKRGLVQKRKIYNDEPQGVSGLVFNMREKPFDDLRMRQAFVHLFNREKLIDQLFYNEYLMLDSYYPGGIYENPNNPKYRFDQDKAIQLLQECGWKKRNNEGWLVNENGETLQFEMMIDKSSERIFTVFQEDLSRVGIKLELKFSTGPTMFKMVNERKFKIHFQSWGGLFFPNPENSWSSWTADPDNTNNLAGVKNDRIDEICRAYDVEFDFDKRVEMVREIDGILMEIQPYALAWYAPFHRILYWNKFGHPDFYLSRTGDWASIISYWWIDPEKKKKLEAAKKDGGMQLEVGDTEVTYWIEYNKKHGRKYNVEGI